MKKGKWKKFIRKLEMLIMLVVLLFGTGAPVTIAEAATKQLTTTSTQNLEDIEFSDFSNWRSGVYYHTNGKYTANSYRICLNNYITFSGDEYKVHITDNRFHLLVRELNANKNFIRSLDLTNGQTYTPGSNAVYLAISVYKFSNGEADMSYDVFKEMFQKGFVAELCPVTNTSSGTTGSTGTTDSTGSTNTQDSTESVKKYSDVENIDFTDFSKWRTGNYNWKTGIYEKFGSRICLNDYVTYRNDEYKVSINATDFRLLIREMDANLKFIQSFELKNAASYEPSADTKYLAISVYSVSGSSLTYESYRTLFNNGFEAKLIAVESEDNSSDIIVTPDTDSSVDTGTNNNTSSNTSNKPKETVYDVLADMIINADTSVKDLTSYKSTYSDFFGKIVPQVIEDLYIECACYRNMYINGDIQGQYMVNCKLNNVDAEAKGRIARTKEAVKEFMASVDPKMKDLDKILFAHEYIVNRTNYQFDDLGACYYAGGPLGNKAGVCSGYTKAYNLLLKEMGIETDYVSSQSMNHAWTYVKVDGVWYHLDTTWDDTRKGTDSKYMHRFLLRNDNEFTTTLTGNLHTDYAPKNTSTKSTSTRFTNWYVHDVAGTMYYYNGMWYYWDINTNSILCSNIEGTVTKVAVDGSNSGKIKINGISDGKLIYSIGDYQYKKSL